MRKQDLPTIAITGAGGFLGSALIKYFTNKEWHVIALVRNTHGYPIKNGVLYREYNLEGPLNISILEGVDYLVHAAYIKRDGTHPDALNMNIEGAKRLLEASRLCKIKRNVFISSMSSHAGAVSAYGQQKYIIEKQFNRTNDVSLRPGLMIGMGGIVKNMAEFMTHKHIVPVIGKGKQPLQIVNVDELGQVIEQVIKRELRGVLTVANPQVYSYKDFCRALARRLKVKIFFVPIPFYVLLPTLRLVSLLRLPLNINEDNLLGLRKLRAVDTLSDLKLIGVNLDNLEECLNKMDFS